MKKLQIILFSVLAMAAAIASAATNQPPQQVLPQPGQTLNGFIAANPDMQRTWITAEDRRAAALARYASACKAGSKGCKHVKSFDPKTRVAVNFKPKGKK